MTNAQIVAELNRIAEGHGGVLKPQYVVAAASDADSPLHSKFEWDDTEAAHQFRLQQARQLIRVTVQLIGNDDQQFKAKVYVSLSTDRGEDGGGYRPLVSVMEAPEYRRQLLFDALQELKRIEEKYRGLRELAGVFAAAKNVEQENVAA